MRSSSLPLPSLPSSYRAGVAIAIAVIALSAVPARGSAQSAHPSAERGAVMAVVTGLFDAMRKGDSTAVRRFFHPRATLATAGATREGAPQITVDAIDAFTKAVGTPHPEPWDERIHDPIVQIDGAMAVVWAPYTFFLGPVLSHCGTNAFQLAKGPDGWLIMGLVDTRRRTGCRPNAGE